MLEFIEKYGVSKTSIIDGVWSIVPNLLSALIVIFLCVLFYLVTSRIFEAALRTTHMQESLIKITVRSLYRGIVIIVSLIFVLGELGVNVTAAVAGVGVLGLAIGFAAQATIANILSGFGIFLDDLYRKGHWVKLADHYGEVVEISLRTTKIRTLDNTYISVPNSVVTSSPVINHSEQGKVRITANVLIAHDESIDHARAVLIEAVGAIKGVLKRPEPQVVVKELGDSAVHLYVRIWVSEPGFEQRYFFLLNEVCKKALDAAGICIPFPQSDVHLVSRLSKKPSKKIVPRKTNSLGV